MRCATAYKKGLAEKAYHKKSLVFGRLTHSTQFSYKAKMTCHWVFIFLLYSNLLGLKSVISMTHRKEIRSMTHQEFDDYMDAILVYKYEGRKDVRTYLIVNIFSPQLNFQILREEIIWSNTTMLSPNMA